MIMSEYLHFLQTLVAVDVSKDVRKIANLVYKHIHTLIPLSTSNGKRIKRLVKLAQTEWNSISSDIQLLEEQTTERVFPITQLKQFSVGPFRGFKKQEDFDLSSKLVLIYGPNGTGKSSFCEALEYSLLGNVAEAESKRFRNQNDYFKNAHTNSFARPILVGIDEKKADITITGDEVLYRFCFIERNRIDNFSRIAAQAPAKQTELISALFGLDDFLEFVRNFTDAMDKYIDLNGVKSIELDRRMQTVIGFRQQIERYPDEVKKITDDENALADKYRSGVTFNQMVLELTGSEEDDGLIVQLERELEEPVGTKSNLTISSLLELKNLIMCRIQEVTAKHQELSKISQMVSYKQLYEAIIQVKDNSIKKCPACQTPLSQTSVNPFEYAENELTNLKYLGELQETIKKLDESIDRLLTKLSIIINTCCSYFHDNNILDMFKTIDDGNAKINWWHSLFEQLCDESIPWQHIEKQVKKLEDTDKEIVQAIEERNKKSNKLKELRGIVTNIIKLQSAREAADNTFKRACSEVEKFKIENASLIEDVEAEKIDIAQNKSIANAYATFTKKINEYNNSLPTKLVADLGDMIVQLYNAFNRHDAEHEKLAAFRLPLQQNQRITISYKSNPNFFFDALQVLSEGHIRCIGLAILAAKNIKEKCPLLIFDDPVNAIDDDHRESIRRAMFEDEFFKDKQIILACHGEEFFKDIQNLLPREQANTVKSVSFLHNNIDHNIIVDHNCSSRNYIIAARTHLDKNEKRDALDKCRKALESLTKNKVWRYVSKFGDGALSIIMRSATAPIELRNLTEQLRSKIAKADFLDQNKADVLDPIVLLLGKDGNSREWRYLNKGTHEEIGRAEFDQQAIKDIVIALDQLDTALTAKKM